MEPTIRTFGTDDTESVVQLWKSCGLVMSWNDPYKDIQRKLSLQPELFFVALLDNRIVGTVMAGYDGHRGWLNYLAVDLSLRQNGIGLALIQTAERNLVQMGCPKINLQIRSTNSTVIEFYTKCGFKIDEVVSMGKRLIDDTIAN